VLAVQGFATTPAKCLLRSISLPSCLIVQVALERTIQDVRQDSYKSLFLVEFETIPVELKSACGPGFNTAQPGGATLAEDKQRTYGDMNEVRLATEVDGQTTTQRSCCCSRLCSSSRLSLDLRPPDPLVLILVSVSGSS
jgi:hypothetical protein